jgi:HlyD family secretion protein
MIAHRLNTIKKCDVIFKLDKGNLINSGTYNEIVNSN